MARREQNSGFHFESIVLPLIPGFVVVPVAWLSAWIGASRPVP